MWSSRQYLLRGPPNEGGRVQQTVQLIENWLKISTRLDSHNQVVLPAVLLHLSTSLLGKNSNLFMAFLVDIINTLTIPQLANFCHPLLPCTVTDLSVASPPYCVSLPITLTTPPSLVPRLSTPSWRPATYAWYNLPCDARI